MRQDRPAGFPIYWLALFTLDNLGAATYELQILGTITALALTLWKSKLNPRANGPGLPMAPLWPAKRPPHK
jgi:hypothetical protein